MRTLAGMVPTLLFLLAVQPAFPGNAGFVTLAREGDTWWFNSPSGEKFFSLGVDCLGGCYGHYEEEPLDPGRRTRVASLLRKWGFNTAACWSSPSFWEDMYFADQIYHGYDYGGDDVFSDDLWNGWLAGQIRDEMQAFLGRRNLIGYFLDNEVDWGEDQVLAGYMAKGPATPGSRALVEFMRERYGDRIAALNEEWGARYPGFAEIAGSKLPEKMPGAMRRAAAAWRNRVASEFYRRYAEVVRQADPDHLILGVRWSGLPDLDLYKAVTAHCDVSSVNDYARYGELNPAYAEYYRVTGKPIMITEWSFSGFPEPGHRSLQFIDVYSQKLRAFGYRKYVLEAARAPFMVGMHWFLWDDYSPQDEAEGGYLPDENMGLVSYGRERIYRRLVKSCRKTHREVEAVHRRSSWPPPPAAKPERIAVERMSPAIDGNLSEWGKTRAIRPEIGESLLPAPSFKHIYYLSWEPGTLYVAAEISDSRLDHPGKEWSWEGDYLSVIVAPKKQPEGAEEKSLFIHLIPTGDGPAASEPYGYSWDSFKDDNVIRVVRRDGRGGYTLEAAIPAETLPGFGSFPGTVWSVDLNYRNVNEIYETRWNGEMVLEQ